FSLHVVSPHVGLLPPLMPPPLEHTAGAIFFSCRFLHRRVSRPAKNEALENSLQETSTQSSLTNPFGHPTRHSAEGPASGLLSVWSGVNLLQQRKFHT